MEANRWSAHHMAMLVAVEALIRTHPNPQALVSALDAAYTGAQVAAALSSMDEPTANLLREMVDRLKALAHESRPRPAV